MAKNTNKKSSVNASTAMPSGKTQLTDKTLGLEPTTRFYILEDGDDTTEGDESEIFVVHNSILTVS